MGCRPTLLITRRAANRAVAGKKGAKKLFEKKEPQKTKCLGTARKDMGPTKHKTREGRSDQMEAQESRLTER